MRRNPDENEDRRTPREKMDEIASYFDKDVSADDVLHAYDEMYGGYDDGSHDDWRW